MEKTTWQFHTNSTEAWDAMLIAIEQARSTIDIEQFIFSCDNIGARFIHALKKKALEGLKIRLLCDEAGSLDLCRSEIPKTLQSLGIEIKFFNSILPWSPEQENILFFRNHRKLMIIDNEIGFTGGICIKEEMRSWRESHVAIEGAVVKEMREAFEVMWNKDYHHFSYYFHRKKRIPNIDHTEKEFSYITSAPLPRKRFMYYELLNAIRQSKKYVYLTTPYYVPNYKLMRAMKRAALRGVDVRILVPETPDHKLVAIASRTFFTATLKAGIKLFQYNATMIHSKTFVVDGTWSSIGSLNLDNVSLRYNFEANLVSTNKEFTAELEKHFHNDLKSAKEVILEKWKRRAFSSKIIELLVWPIRKLL